MPFVQANDVKLHYEMEGSGPPLLMVAGTGLAGATWRTGPSAQYAAEGFTVITFDHRPAFRGSTRREYSSTSGCDCACTLVIHDNDAIRGDYAFRHLERHRDRATGK